VISTREIALLTGVSQSTVSRSLNDHPGISVETKERVRKIAREHGYTEKIRKKEKSFSADHRAIGILLTSRPFFDDLFINYTMNLLTRNISMKNYYPLPLLDYSSENNGSEKLRDLIRLNILDGFIILARHFDEGIHRYLDDMGMPHVYLLHYSRDSVDSINIVDSDNFGGGYLGTKHLLDYGHRQILTLSSPWREFMDRTNGYRKALMEFGIESRDDFILAGDCTIQDGYSLIRHNSDLMRQITAIYAQNDLLAFGAIQALREEKFRVPEDISVIGSDGYELGLMCYPQLDSVAHPISELTELAINRLLELNNSESYQSPRRQILHPFVIHRESVSTGPT
jgi:LacI family transcriptional regulator